MHFDPNDTVEDHCPHCNTTSGIQLAESTNYGNVIAMCITCATEWDWTLPNYAEIHTEAQRGF